MKNKGYLYTIIIVIVLIIITIINFFVFGFNNLNNKITNKKWYHYNFNNGYYDVLNMYGDTIEYKSYSSKNNYENCYTYNYDKKNNIIKLDCKLSIKINKITENSLEVRIDDYDLVFFNNIEDSVNYEFKNYFGKSILDFKEEKNQVMEYSKINYSKLLSVIKEKGYSKIVFIGDNCTTIDCTLSLDIMEKWITTHPNIYYFDSNELNNKLIKNISKLNKELDMPYEFYNGIYPRIVILKNGKIIDSYDIKCSGFNCSSYYKNEF